MVTDLVERFDLKTLSARRGQRAPPLSLYLAELSRTARRRARPVTTVPSTGSNRAQRTCPPAKNRGKALGALVKIPQCSDGGLPQET
jgi:hypothetical protein